MALTRPTVTRPWADNGDKISPTDPELDIGWPVTDIPPSRQRFNWFFNWVSNAARYLTRRGVADWVLDEDYKVGDIQRSLVDGKTYRAILDNINFEPSVSPLKWERWGFSLSELWAYISTGLYSATVCPNAGPSAAPMNLAAPTLVAPWLEYTSALGEIWRFVGGTWRVVANRYKITDTVYTTAAGNQTFTFFTFTSHRAGTLSAHFYTSAQGGVGAALLQCAIYKNGGPVRYMDSTRTSANDGMDVSASAAHTVAVGDVMTFVSTGNNCGTMSAIHSLSYTD